eukprot:508825_1
MALLCSRFMHSALFVSLLMMHTKLSNAIDIQSIDDIYSFNNIYMAWTVSPPIENISSQLFQYRECGTHEFITIPVIDVSERYNALNVNGTVYSISLNNLKEDTVYEFQIHYTTTNTTSNIYRMKTLSASKEDWKYYLQKSAPYVIGAVGSVILTEAALSALGFGAIGITAESIAAGIQSSIGPIEAGSIFAMLQSEGMAGMSATTTLGIALSGAGKVAIIDELLQDECDNNIMEETLRSVQHYVMNQIDELDIESLSNHASHQFDHDIQEIQDLVQKTGKSIGNEIQKTGKSIGNSVENNVHLAKKYFSSRGNNMDYSVEYPVNSGDKELTYTQLLVMNVLVSSVTCLFVISVSVLIYHFICRNRKIE